MIDKLKNYAAMKTLKAFLPTIGGWLTRKSIEVAGYTGVAITAYYEAKKVAVVEVLTTQGAPPDQIVELVAKSGDFVSAGVALIPSIFAIIVSLFLSRVSAKLSEK